MPRVKIDRIVSFSSEDPENPCSNLLEPEVTGKKWLGQKGESSHSVVLQLSKCTKIDSVAIGSHHSALVEVLVGRSEKQTDPFKVLVLSSIFMTPSESKKEENVSKVRRFQYNQLSPETRDESWDRIRIVCLQPYNKHVKYGLSFIHIFEPEVSKTTEPVPITTNNSVSVLHSSQRFTISAASSDDEDSYKPGELFAKAKAGQMSVEAQIRQASKTSSVNSPAHSQTKLSRIEIKGNKPNNNRPETCKRDTPRDRDNLFYTDEEEPNEKIDRIIKRDREVKEKHREDTKISREDKERSSKGKDRNSHREPRENGDRAKSKTDKREHSTKPSSSDNQPKNKDSGDSRSSDTRDATSKKDREGDRRSSDQREGNRNSRKRARSDEAVNSRSPPKKLKAGARTSSPQRLLSDVVFVLSGYENPTRARLRDKALAMGAQYRRDWSHDCTHLVCAFANTPKLRLVRSKDDRVAIVTGEWVERCCQEMRRLPWQWFATEPDYRVERDDRDDTRRASEEDTDDEIEKVIKQHKEESSNNKNSSDDKLNSTENSDVVFVRDVRIKAEVSVSDSETDEYTEPDVYTEPDEYTEPENETDVNDIFIDLKKKLPDFFEGFTFAVDTDMYHAGIDCNLIKRYIIAYSGELVEHVSYDSTVNYVISLNPTCSILSKVPRAVVVSPDWIWRCHKKRTKVSSKDYIVK